MNLEFPLLTRMFNLTRGFIASTRAFNPAKSCHRAFSFLTGAVKLVTSRFELVTPRLDLVTCGFELVTRKFELVTCEVELVTCKPPLVTPVLLFHVRMFF